MTITQSRVTMARCTRWYIGNDMQFSVPLLIVLGLVFTIWSQTFIMIGLEKVLYRYIRNDAMFIAIVLTCVVAFVPTSVVLYYGVKHNNVKLVRWWYVTKIIECLLIIVDVVLHIPRDFINAVHFDIIVELLILPLGIYLTACVIKISKIMTSPSSIYQEVIIEQPAEPNVLFIDDDNKTTSDLNS